MKVFKDSARQQASGQQLFENKTYHIDFEDSTETEILEEIKNSKLEHFINWQHGNQYATLNIINFIGNFYFFGNTYDVKSQKFLIELTGSEQFQKILNDIHKLSKHIIFIYSSPSFVLRQVDYKDANPTLLLMFNYFKTIIINWDSTINLESDIQRLINNPHYQYSFVFKTDRIEKIKKIDSKTLQSLSSNHKNYVKLDSSHENLLNLPVTQFISKNSKDNYFPTKALMKKKYLSHDTLENKFVKFFFEYIESIAYKLNAIHGLPKNVVKEKEQILSFCRTTLNQPFFKNIGQMRMIPIHSTVLHNRTGYKEILSHYTRSRFGVKHVFEDFEQKLMSIDLKKISDLYEYWVFYQIATRFLGDEIIIEQKDVEIKDDKISYGVCFKNETISVYYNWTESRKSKSSYSVPLRPDTTVTVQKDSKVIKFVFDAKYKVQHKKGKEGIEYHVKSEDIHKMHSYLDALNDCAFAVVVYPGSEFYFYERDVNNSIRRDVKSIESFEGVGAVPLVPEDKALNEQFTQFVETIKKKFIYD